MSCYSAIVRIGLILFFVASASLQAASWKALIVDGQNNHDWKNTTPVLKRLLEETRRFVVDVATTPSKGQDMSTFKPRFQTYKLVVLNYNGDHWPAETQSSFLNYVRGGGGVLVFHAANNAFPDWPEFNEIIGLGGWGGRNEKSGPYLRLRDGRWTPDNTPGRGGSHGPQHAFTVDTQNPDHPVMKGLPPRWMHTKDELYDRMRGPARNLQVLASSFSSPEQRGTGEHEPMLIALRYGKGRIFHTMLGHGPEAMRCVGFIVTLQRGAEWAVSGKVRQKVPVDFPTEKQESLR